MSSPYTEALQSAPTCTVATALLFGTVTFTYVSLAAKTYFSGDTRAVDAASNPISTALDTKSFVSIYTLLHHLTVFGGILLFAYICEYHPPFPHGEKFYNRDEFFFATGVLFLCSAYTVTRNDRTKEAKDRNGVLDGDSAAGGLVGKAEDGEPKFLVKRVKACDDVLNRDQTEEWKGWMQYMFLLYHYYHAEEVYNSIRIMITCYVWMTGFGNFSFFYTKGDYSIVRVLQMLWRLNFLVLFLVMSQGTTYILYYICPLHTFFFMMVYTCMRTCKNLNYSKYGLRLKLAVLALIIFLVWDVDIGLFKLMHFPFLSSTPKLGAGQGSMWEWYFRSTLDHWSTFLGMIFAANYPITSLFYRKLEAQPLYKHVIAKALVGIAMLAAFGWWVTGPFLQPKIEYNATNSYFGFIPLITYIYFRNITPQLRSYSIDLLHQIGKTTLETYLMQHHIWLTSNAKSLLVLIPGWPWVNFLVVSILYFFISRRLYKLTLFLRGMFLPDNAGFCLKSLLGIGVTVGACNVVAMILSSAGMASLFHVGILSAICGLVLYYMIICSTWSSYYDDSSQATIARDGKSYKRSPLLFGATSLLLIGLSWSAMAKFGAGQIQPLGAHCSSAVNDGSWIPIDPCAGDQRGQAFRDYGVGSLSCGSQSPVYAWGWAATKSNSRCRFSHRDTKTLLKSLQNRRVVFIGDSMVRLLFQATYRALGGRQDYYNASVPKHADINERIDSKNIDLQFKWAPLAIEEVNAMKAYNGLDKEQQPDLIVIGGGSWDRLHVYEKDRDQTALKRTLGDLSGQIKFSRDDKGVPVVWMVPNVIHSDALVDEAKRDHMKEEDLEQIRQLYIDRGVLESSSFVLDGPAFTRDRVEESYDGVHYPPGVYDAGAQILANALDWVLLPPSKPFDPPTPPQPGKMANVPLGFFMLLVVFCGLFLFDGFMGFSYFAGLIVTGAMPCSLYEEAFSDLHRKLKLPPVAYTIVPVVEEEEMHFLTKKDSEIQMTDKA